MTYHPGDHCPICGSGDRNVRRRRGGPNDVLPGWFTLFATGPECECAWHDQTPGEDPYADRAYQVAQSAMAHTDGNDPDNPGGYWEPAIVKAVRPLVEHIEQLEMALRFYAAGDGGSDSGARARIALALTEQTEGLKKADGTPLSCHVFITCPRPVVSVRVDEELGAVAYCAQHDRTDLLLDDNLMRLLVE